MLTVTIVLVAAAFLVTIISAFQPVPLWIAVLLLCIVELLRVLPIGR
jgi:hypothetical protein